MPVEGAEHLSGSRGGWLEALRYRMSPRRLLQDELLASLNDVASAVSSTLSVDEVLNTIVDRAKRVTSTQKAVLLLTTDHSDTLDFDTLTVRGSRDELPEEWWAGKIRDMASEVLHNGRTYLDHDKRQHALMLCAPIKVRIGLLCAINDEDRPFTGHQVEYLAILSSFAAAAVENARLAEENSYVLLASERDRIAREMHDGIAQSLFSISLGLEVCKKQVFRDPQTVAERLEELQDELNVSMVELRRVIYDLRPAKLQELGLAASVEHWVKEATNGRDVEGEVIVRGEPRFLTGALEACLYRVAKETVSNIVRHADASHFEVLLDYKDRSVILFVSDDGRGFDVDQVLARRETDGSIGLHSITHRVRGEGGVVDIRSEPGKGTQVRVEIPL